MRKIKLTQGKVALVDNNMFDCLNKHKWHAYCHHRHWYAIRSIRKANGKQTTQSMHRIIINIPKGLQIDHQNHNGLDNRKSNLRICTNAQNQYNQKLRQGSSKYKGVYLDKQREKWKAQIQLNNKQIHIGRFLDEIDAAKAYDKKAIELFGKFACLNFR